MNSKKTTKLLGKIKKGKTWAKYSTLGIACAILLAGCGNQDASSDTSKKPSDEEQITTTSQQGESGDINVGESLESGEYTVCQDLPDEETYLYDFTVNYLSDPIGISYQEAPVFGWKMHDYHVNAGQKAYEIQVALGEDNLLSGNYVWDSGKVESNLSTAILYEGEALLPGQSYVYQVQVWNQEDALLQAREGAFSGTFETGMDDALWNQAEWIGAISTSTAKTGDVFPETDEKETVVASGDGFVIGYQCQLGRTFSGFVYGSTNRQYEDSLLVAIDTRGEEPEAVLATVCQEQMENEKRVNLTAAGVPIATYGLADPSNITGVDGAAMYQVQIQNTEKELVVRINDTEVFRESCAAPTLGQFGFWTERGSSYGYFDDLCIEDLQGKVLCIEDFEEESSTVFAPYYLKTVQGMARISAGYTMIPGGERPAPMLSRAFVLQPKEMQSARWYVSALGTCSLSVNGMQATEDFFTPGQSQYNDNVYYRTYDVTNLLQPGQNVLGVVLGHGRYDRAKFDWGDEIAYRGMLQIIYADGSRENVFSDADWMVYTDGPVRSDDMFMGEVYDARYEIAGWNTGDYWFGSEEEASVPRGWKVADIIHTARQGGEEDEISLGLKSLQMIPAIAEPVRCLETIHPVSITEPQTGIYVCDFGVNMTGVCSINGTVGDDAKVSMRYAELVNQEDMAAPDDAVGLVWTAGLFTAKNTDYYMAKAAGETFSYTPEFVCRGFRYVQIEGLEERPTPEDISCFVLSSDLQRTGYFESSDDNLNLLYDSIYRTQVSNYMDVPTDCPQRDERLGWAGDAQVFSATASYNSNVRSFLGSYLKQFVRSQEENGAYREIVPAQMGGVGTNGWSDAGVIIVWELYQQYGDTNLIRKHLDSMCAYVDYLVSQSPDFIRQEGAYGDHNAVSEVPKDFCSTAQCAYVSGLLAKMCGAVGEDARQNCYQSIRDQYAAAWRQTYVGEDGTIGDWLQSSYVLGLGFDLYPEALAAQGAAYLNTVVEAGGYHPTTGYIATEFLLPVLCRYGYGETAYKLIHQEEYPSWNNMLSYGGTTMPESWWTVTRNDAGSLDINGSLNHYGLGTVGYWMYSGILGIQRDEENPGFSHFVLAPVVDETMEYAQGSYESVYGTIESSWKVNSQEIVYRFVIPANTSATVKLQGDTTAGIELGAGTYEFAVAR